MCEEVSVTQRRIFHVKRLSRKSCVDEQSGKDFPRIQQFQDLDYDGVSNIDHISSEAEEAGLAMPPKSKC